MNDYNVLEEIKLIRNRYNVILGKKSFSLLHTYLLGFQSAEKRFKVCDESFPENQFNAWLIKKYQLTESSYNKWDYIILNYCKDNQIKAFDLFFELLDQFFGNDQLM